MVFFINLDNSLCRYTEREGKTVQAVHVCNVWVWVCKRETSRKREELIYVGYGPNHSTVIVTLCLGQSLGWIHFARAASHRVKVHAERQEQGVRYKDRCFLGICPKSSFKIVFSLSPEDRQDYYSAKPSLRDVFKKKKIPLGKSANLSEVFLYSKVVICCFTIMRFGDFYTMAVLKDNVS